MKARSVRVVMTRYEGPAPSEGRPKGRYQAIGGCAKTLEVLDERAEIRLWETISTAIDLFIADELIAKAERSGAIGPAEDTDRS